MQHILRWAVRDIVDLQALRLSSPLKNKVWFCQHIIIPYLSHQKKKKKSQYMSDLQVVRDLFPSDSRVIFRDCIPTCTAGN